MAPPKKRQRKSPSASLPRLQPKLGSSNTSSQNVLSQSDQAFQGSQQQALDAFDQGLQEDGYEDYDVMDINPDRVNLSHDEDPAAGGGSANSQQAIAPLHPQVPPCY
ncbi:hypothetical protein Ndes2437B_g01900 [Nannochloris sp. 'desiccata']|nr:hypothetical protein KSW81_006927 [Chlorella desiccata (nom. nud.)]